MRKIKDLLENNERVWFYIGEDKSVRSSFAQELRDLHFTFTNGEPVSDDSIGRIMSVHNDGKIAYVSLMVWSYSFNPGDGSCGVHHSFADILKTDYEKYISSYDSSYIIEKN